MRSSTFIANAGLHVLTALAVFGTPQLARVQAQTTGQVQTTRQAQTTQQAQDRPSQRWLPLPQGKSRSDPYQLAERLRQIRNRVIPDDSTGSLPNLSEEQLRQLDDVARQWQDNFGDVPLPSWDSIPKELIDSVLADPEQRRQAQRLLEQYARQRQLPVAGRGLELPRNPDATDIATQTSSDVIPGSKSLATPFDQSHDQVPPEHDKALRELLSKLRAVEAAQRASRAASPGAQADSRFNPGGLRDASSKSQAASDGRSTSGANQLPNTGPRAAPLPAASAKADRRTPELAPGPRGQSSQTPRDSMPAQRPTDGSGVRPDGTERSLSGRPELKNPANPTVEVPRPRANNSTMPPDTSNRAGSQSTNATGADRAETSARVPADDTDPFDLPGDPKHAEGGTSSGNLSGDHREAIDSFDSATAQAQQGEARGRRRNSKPLRSQLPTDAPQASASTSSSSTSQDALQQDIRKQIERLGLGPALRRIAEKAFKEQLAEATKVADTTTNSPSSGSSRQTGTKVSPDASANANTKNRASSNKAFGGGNSQRQTSSTGSGSSMATWAKDWSNAIQDVLKSLATVPGTGREAGAASSAANTAPDWKRELSWHGRGIESFAAVILIGLLCVALLSTRKRLAATSSARASERSWAKEILAEGIRTRADVVRAFHRLVLRTTQPVAAWWTHRYAAKRLSESRPQLCEAMQELSRAYEQARYMPPDADLTDEQLSRVRAALQQCAAYRVSNAST